MLKIELEENEKNSLDEYLYPGQFCNRIEQQKARVMSYIFE